MQIMNFQETEQLFALPVDLNLTVNDLRILVTSLNGLAYFRDAYGEADLDNEALDLKERLERAYESLLNR